MKLILGIFIFFLGIMLANITEITPLGEMFSFIFEIIGGSLMVSWVIDKL